MSRVGRRGSWTLIELLVAVVILAALAAWLLPRYLTSTKNAAGQTTIQAPIQRAQGADCSNNLHQIRLAITMAQQTDEHFPASLNELLTNGSGLSRQMLVCPVSNMPYVYDPATGRVSCPYPPHRSY
jgi:type II secretory pathway pseudopilin PulG